MRRLMTGLLAGFLCLWAQSALAYVGLCCGKCGGNMPMNIPGGGVPETAEFRFKLTPSFMHMSGLRSGTHGLDASAYLGPPNGGTYMAVPTEMDMAMLSLSAGYSFTDDFFAGIMFMWMDKRMDMALNGPMMTATGLPGFTMRSSGMGDTMLMTKYRLFTDDPLIPTRQASLLVGLSLPTGSIDEKNGDHPLALRRPEQLPYGMQLGTGTFDPTLGLLYQGSASPWWWGANATGTWRLYDNARGYRVGDRYALDLYAMRQFRPDALLQLQLNAEHQGTIHGVMDEYAAGLSGWADSTRDDGASANSNPMTPLWDPDHYGGNKVYATVGAQWQPRQMHILDLAFQVPVHQNLNGPQLEDDWRVMLTWYVEVPTRLSIRHPDNPLTHRSAGGPDALGF
jgi:hypothetical protein